MRWRRRPTVLALVAATSLLATSCSPDKPTLPPGALIVGIGELGPLDPIAGGAIESTAGSALVARQALQGLITPDPETRQPTGLLASSFKSDAEGRTWTFQLREGVKFHSGKVLTSDDVVFTLNRLARAACAPESSPEAGAPSYLLSLIVGYADVAQACSVESLPGLQAIGDSTIGIALSEPFADFPLVLSSPATAIVAEGSVSEISNGKPDGTGPYEISQPWNGSEIILKAFPDYWERQPQIKEIRFIGHADGEAAWTAMVAGRLHVSFVPPGRSREALRRFGDQGIKQGAGLMFLGVNFRSPRMSSLNVRRAIGSAIDRDGIGAAVYGAVREPARGIVPTAIGGPAACIEFCRQDSDDARKRLRGGPTEISLAVPQEGGGPAVGEAVVKALADVGVTVRLTQRPLVDHIKGIRAADADLFLFGWIPAYSAADGILFPLFRSGAPDNLMGYANPSVDTKLAEARASRTYTARAARFAEAEQQILADAAIIPLLWYRSSLVFDPRLRAAEDIFVDETNTFDAWRLVFN